MIDVKILPEGQKLAKSARLKRSQGLGLCLGGRCDNQNFDLADGSKGRKMKSTGCRIWSGQQEVRGCMIGVEDA